MGQRPTFNNGDEPNEEHPPESSTPSANSSASSTTTTSNYMLYAFDDKSKKEDNDSDDEESSVPTHTTTTQVAHPPAAPRAPAKISVDSRGKSTLPVHLDTIEDLLAEYDLSRKDLFKLLNASKKYVKVSTESSGHARTLVLTAYFRPSVQTNPPHTVKISTFHDIKEVTHDFDAMTLTNSRRRFLVMGARRKQELYDGKEYQLQYWCQFDVLFEGMFSPDRSVIPYYPNSNEPFARRCRGEAEMYYANILTDDKHVLYGTLVCRENKEDTLFSLKWTSVDDYAESRPYLPADHVPATPIDDLEIFDSFASFHSQYSFIFLKLYDMLKWDPLSYAKFIETARTLYSQKFEGLYLTRLDAVVE